MAITTLTAVKEYLEISGTDQDAKITALIPLCEQTYLDIRHAPWDIDKDTQDIVYPTGSGVTIAEMISYKLVIGKENGREVASESIDNYSVSFNSGSGMSKYGYPTSILAAIKKYIDGR